MAQLSNPISPTASLPPLHRLSNCSLIQVVDALTNLRIFYFPSPLTESLRVQKNAKPHAHHDKSAPDSGYASAEEDDDDLFSGDDEGNEALELLRSNAPLP
jgi:hypothetical protein